MVLSPQGIHWKQWIGETLEFTTLPSRPFLYFGKFPAGKDSSLEVTTMVPQDVGTASCGWRPWRKGIHKAQKESGRFLAFSPHPPFPSHAPTAWISTHPQQSWQQWEQLLRGAQKENSKKNKTFFSFDGSRTHLPSFWLHSSSTKEGKAAELGGF